MTKSPLRDARVNLTLDPPNGDCQGVLALDIEQGHHGNTKLDGLKVAAVVSWPGAIHEGHGTIQLLVDERATPQQREALLRIMSGLDTEPGATIFQVFSTTYDKVHDPIFTAIELNIDVEGRRATLRCQAPLMLEGNRFVIRSRALITGYSLISHRVLSIRSQKWGVAGPGIGSDCATFLCSGNAPEEHWSRQAAPAGFAVWAA
jgi:hypothetical protein